MRSINQDLKNLHNVGLSCLEGKTMWAATEECQVVLKMVSVTENSENQFNSSASYKHSASVDSNQN